MAGRESPSVRRVYLLAAVLALWGLAIGARLWSLQVVRASELREKALDSQENTIEIMPLRGAIYDRELNKLAVSTKEEASVSIVPAMVDKPKETARLLSRITGVSAEKLLARLESGKESGKKSVPVERDITEAERAALKKAGIPGIHFIEEYQRSYPNQEMAAHVLGYVNTDEVGLGGLELRYDSIIKGEPGRAVLQMDAQRKVFQRIEQAPRPGADLVTTIDPRVQFIVEQEIREVAARTRATGIYIVVQDPRNGAILAMANYPAFNPNQQAKYSAETKRNNAVSLTYEPGSTFKIVTVIGALEENLTTPDERIYCEDGHILISGHRINDHKPFGVLSVREIMQYSSDVGAIKLGLRLGEERLDRYIRRLGFGRMTSVDLAGDENGRVAPVSQWWKGSIGSISMGQEIAVTPLQIVNLVSAVANGGTLYRPYVVQKINDPVRGTIETIPMGQKVISPRVAQQLQEILEEVVVNGTGKGAKLNGYRAAERRARPRSTIPRQEDTPEPSMWPRLRASPPFPIPSFPSLSSSTSRLGSTMGGEVAAPVFKRIADKVLRGRSVVPDVPGYDPRYIAKPEKSPKTSPGTGIDKPRPQPRRADSGWKVVDASMGRAASSIEPYEVGDSPVPDFSGLSVREALEQAAKAELKVVISGSGRAAVQRPAAGSRVRRGSTVQVRFSVQ